MLTSVTFEATSGTLDIALDNNDDVSIQANEGQVEVLVNGTATGSNPPAADVWSISINGGEGNNSIDLSGVTSAEFSGSPTIEVCRRDAEWLGDRYRHTGRLDRCGE